MAGMAQITMTGVVSSERRGSMPQARVLIADDQPDVLMALGLLLKGAGFLTVPAGSPPAVIEAVRKERFSAILLDLNYTRDTTSGQEGLDLLVELQAIGRGVPVIVMTAWGSMELAVEAMRRGARDFVLKPWDNNALLQTLRKQIEEAGRESSLQQAHDEEEQRLKEDMAIARQVQNNLFPRNLKPIPTLEYAGACLQAGAVGGDYYDFLDLGSNRVAALLADVSGKGISAALLMANLQATLRSQFAHGAGSLASQLAAAHRLFFDSTERNHYATLFFSTYDPCTRKLRYVNCGHNPPLLLRAGGEAQWLEATATVLGLLSDWSCEEGETDLNPGDLLLIYSDGVTEAGSHRDQQFGEPRLLELFRRCRGLPMAYLLVSLIEEVQQYAGGAQEDDLTVVVLRSTAA